MNWRLSDRADPAALPIADRHYNRQKPGTPQFVPPGRCFVLTCATGTALWVTSWPFPEYCRHAWAGAWINSAFRREDGPVASGLIWEALAATRWRWPNHPQINCVYCDVPVSMVTFIDRDKVKRKRDFGRCYRKAGFKVCKGETKGGLFVLHISPEDMPDAMEPIGAQSSFELIA